MIDLTYQTGNSPIHKMDPFYKLCGVIGLTILILLTKGPLCLIISISLTSLLLYFSKISFRSLLKPMKRLGIFLLTIFVMNLLFYSGESCIYRSGPICISKDGAMQGFDIVMHTFFVTLLSIIFIRTTTSIEIMKALEKLMSPLRLFGIPTKDIALIMSISLQFIPVFFSDIDRIRKAQTARGVDFSKGSVVDRAKSVFPLVIPAFISAFRRADELSLAIEARGFQSEKDSMEGK